MTQELQRTSIFELEDDAKKAFFINIYNALVVHAYVAVRVI